MFLKINTGEIAPLQSHRAHILSDAVTMLGTVASLAKPYSSQTERQFGKLQTLLRRLTRTWPLDERSKAITYGESCFWDKPTFVHLSPDLQHIVDAVVEKAKAA